MAESTFGRHAVNDGKIVQRLRFGGRVTTQTVQLVRQFIARHGGDATPLGAGKVPAASPFAPMLALSHEQRYSTLQVLATPSSMSWCSSRPHFWQSMA